MRSRRLRKKLYVDEFAVFGFEIRATCEHASQEDYDQFLDTLIDFIEERQLMMAGAGNPQAFSAFIYSEHRYGSATENDRQEIKSWLANHCPKIHVSERMDAFYGDFQ